MRALPLALALLIAGPVVAHAATDDELRKQIVGRWGETAECQGSVLVFNEDGSFLSDNLDGDPENDMKGTFAIKGGVLTGHADESDMPEVSIRFEGTDKLFFEAGGKATDTLIRCSADAAPQPGGAGSPAPAAPAPAPEPAPAQ